MNTTESMISTESMGTTEMVSRVVLQARRSARLASEVDEQAWFDAGEPDTVPNFPRQAPPRDRASGGLPTWLLLLGASVPVIVGYAIGFYLGRG